MSGKPIHITEFDLERRVGASHQPCIGDLLLYGQAYGPARDSSKPFAIVTT